MVVRAMAGLLVASALVGCVSSEVPKRSAGIGFGDYDASLGEPANQEQLQRSDSTISEEAQIGQVAVAGPAPSFATSPPGGAVTAEDLAAAGIGFTAAASASAEEESGLADPSGSETTGLLTTAASSVTVPTARGLSDEQSFEAVAARETIQSDAARLQRQRAARVDLAPEALPERTAETGPDIAAYALATRHPVGQARFKRFLASDRKAARVCRRYPGSDLAQRAFLEAGGPERDRLGVDPDGDGYACDWSPEPFRAARG